MLTKLIEDRRFQNNPEDFQIPYRYAGTMDAENLWRVYKGMRKISYGVKVRLGHSQPKY